MAEVQPRSAAWLLWLAVVALFAGAELRGALAPRLPEGVLAEVEGDVPRPGTYLASSMHGALRQAGAAAPAGPNRALYAPVRLVVDAGRVTEASPAEPLLLGALVDLNRADAGALATVPGMGAATAEAVAEDRGTRGPLYAVGDLERVAGIGPATAARLAPFVTVGDVGPRPDPSPLDVNTAGVHALVALPGIGPTLAGRIVADRAQRGSFGSVDALRRVKGIGPATVERLRPLVVVGQ